MCCVYWVCHPHVLISVDPPPFQVKLVLERTPASLDEGDVALLPPWYYKGREGITTWQVRAADDSRRAAAAVGSSSCSR